MAYLQRINYRPNTDDLTDKEQQYLQQHFDAYGAEMVAHGEAVPWQQIEEVEVARAARAAGPSGWLVKRLLMGGERYHVAVYFGRREIVFTNITLKVAQYILRSIAYYAAQPIQYTGADDVVALSES